MLRVDITFRLPEKSIHILSISSLLPYNQINCQICPQTSQHRSGFRQPSLLNSGVDTSSAVTTEGARPGLRRAQ